MSDASPERQYAEEVAMLLERMGMTRGAGRLLGWLLICNPPRQSTADLVDALGVSKASVSSAVRMLESVGLLERVVVPGNRLSYYEVRPDGFEMAHQQAGTLRLFADLMDSGLRVIKDKAGPRRARLHETREFLRFMEREYPQMVKRFQQEYRQQECDRHG